MRLFALALAATLLAGFATPGASADDWKDRLKDQLRGSRSGSSLGETEAANGIREAMAQGVHRAITRLGTKDGFWGDEAMRIRLPGQLGDAAKLARQLGRGDKVDAFELSMNRAAEKAIPVAADVFADAVRQMTVRDAIAIVRGEPDAATNFFRRATEERLREKFLPIVARATGEAGVTRRYKSMMGGNAQVAQLLGGRGQSLDLDRYVTDRALDGLYRAVADEEREIRENPSARGTDLLRKVFGSR